MKKNSIIQDQSFWPLQSTKRTICDKDMQVDVVVVGAGMAGISAAQAWQKRGKKVMLVDQFYCGGGASGKSAGFITPNAELSFTDFSHRFSPQGAFEIWNFISSGVEDIRKNILEHNFNCDYNPQNTLVLANTQSGLKRLKIEHDNLAKFGYQTEFYTKDTIQSQIASKDYYGGVSYDNTFGINGYEYCQAMKHHLQSLGVLVFEETPVLQINDHVVVTAHAKITADYIVVCTDRFTPDLGLLSDDVYHAQTYVLASQKLSDDQVKNMFPDKKLMVWDTEMIYNYFRMTGDNRLLIGGGDVASTYSTKANHEYQPIINKLTNYLAQHFPAMDVTFEYMWPGLIGTSKDVGPIGGPDKDRPYIYYVAAVCGLPIAAALGRYSAEHLVDGARHLDHYFTPYRKYPISGFMQKVLGKKLSFFISNMIKTNIP